MTETPKQKVNPKLLLQSLGLSLTDFLRLAAKDEDFEYEEVFKAFDKQELDCEILEYSHDALLGELKDDIFNQIEDQDLEFIVKQYPQKLKKYYLEQIQDDIRLENLTNPDYICDCFSTLSLQDQFKIIDRCGVLNNLIKPIEELQKNLPLTFIK